MESQSLWGFKRKQVAGNGDCCFLAVAIGIETFFEDGSQKEMCTHLNALGFHLGQNISNRVAILRSLVVEEFLGKNSKEYLMFLVDSDQECFEEMAKHFLEQGFFDCELGNGVLLALVNVLKCSIVCFSSITNYPVIPLIPRQETLSSIPIDVAFTQFGKGHYDAVMMQIPEHSAGDSGRGEVSQIQKCSCGRGGAKDKTKEFCHEYNSRCKCFQNMQRCGNMCKCINCGNPYGSNQKSPEVKMKRKRKRHHNTPESSLDFLQAKGEPLASAKWTDYDNHLLQQVANIVVGIEDNRVPDYETVFHLFKEISTSKDTSLLSLKDNKSRVDKFLRDRAAFRIMLRQQLHLDYDDN